MLPFASSRGVSPSSFPDPDHSGGPPDAHAGSDRLWLLPAALVLAVGCVTAFSLTLGHDVAWCLHAAGRVADGARLYRDLIELNPPLIIWLALPPVLLARLVGGSEIVLFQGYVLGIVIVSLALCARLSRLALAPYPARTRGLFLSLLALFFIPWEDYGQREHLMLLLVSPYLLAATALTLGRKPGRVMSVAVGVMAGVGLAIKPYFLFLWVGVELYLAWRLGPWSLRREQNIAIAAVLLCYGIAVAAVTPEYREIIGMALESYGAYNCRFSTLFNRTGAAVVALALIVPLLFRLTPPDRAARRVLLIAAVTLFAGVLLQRKGWGYQYYPADVTGRLVIFLTLWIFLERIPAAAPLLRWGRTGLAVAAALGILLAAGIEHRVMRRSPITGMDLLATVRRHAAGEYITLLSTSVTYPFPLVNYSGARWGSRFPALWLLPAAYAGVGSGVEGRFPYHPPKEMGTLERYTVDALVEDLTAHPPALLIVDRHADKQGFGVTRFDYLEYFARDPRFARIIAGYDSLATVDSMLVLRRRGTEGSAPG